MRTAKRVIKNTVVLTGSEVLNKVLSLFLYIAIANYLKDIGYGKFSFIMTLLSFFQVIANFGLDKLTIREVAKFKDKTHQYVSSMLRFKVLLAVLAYIILIIFINLTGKTQDVVWGVYLIGLSILFVNLSNTYMAIFNAHEKLEINAILLVIVKFVILGLTFIGIYFKVGLLFILSFFVIGEALRTLAFYYLYHKHFKVSQALKSSLLSKKTIISAAPFAAIGVASLIYNHIDIVMLSLMIGDKAVGWYSAAYNLILGLMFIPRCYTLSVFPVLSRFAQDSRDMLYFTWQKSIKMLLAISVPISVGVYILSSRFINLFYASGSYAYSALALQILMFAMPWIFINAINMYLLYAANKQKEATMVVIVSTIINIGLNLVLIPKYSYLGASWTTVIAEIINVCLFFWLISYLLKLDYKDYKAVIKVIVSSSILGVVIYKIINLPLVMIIVLGCLLYVGLLIGMRYFDREEIQILKEVFSKNKKTA
jgi:O-antigen/teichoic acid export membrane protein